MKSSDFFLLPGRALMVFALVAWAPHESRADEAPGPRECGGGLTRGEVCLEGGREGLCRMMPHHKGGMRLGCDTAAPPEQVAAAKSAALKQVLSSAGAVVGGALLLAIAVARHRGNERRKTERLKV